MRERLIEELDGADLFLRNRANSTPTPLNEYDIEAMLDIAKICDEAARVLERAIVPPCKVGDKVYYISFGKVYEGKCHAITMHNNLQIHLYDYDGDNASYPASKVFLTREEAEAALKGGGQK